MNAPSTAFRLCAALTLAAAVVAAQFSTVNVQVSNRVDTSAGVNGRLQLAMSTSFQLAGWSYQFFNQAPNAQTPLGALNPWHTRVQVISDGIPLTAPGTWDFTKLNTMLSPIQGASDHSPEFQIGTAPAYLSDSSGHILPTSFSSFAQMSANLVHYYNTGDFDESGKHFQSTTPYPVTWLGFKHPPGFVAIAHGQYFNTAGLKYVNQRQTAFPSHDEHGLDFRLHISFPSLPNKKRGGLGRPQRKTSQLQAAT